MIAGLNIHHVELHRVIHDPALVGSVEEFCAPPSGPLSEQDASRRCRAARATRRAMCRLMATSIPACNSRCPPAMYASKNSSISGLLPAAPGSALHQYGRSGRMLEVRPLRLMLALSGAGVHGRQYARASIQDCEKSFARTGIPSENLLKKRPDLAQIHNFDPASPRST